MMTRDFDIKQLIDDAKRARRVFIAGHRNPDGDAVGSCFALALMFRDMDVYPTVLLDKYSSKFSYLNGAEYIRDGDICALSPEVMVCLDSASKERLGIWERVFDMANITYNIDHHVSNTIYADNNYVSSGASSTSELVFALLEGAGIDITQDIAAALYTGIITDTGCLRHASTTPFTMETTAKLMGMGIDFPMIQRKAIYEHSLVEAKILALAINRMIVHSEFKFAITTLSNAQMKEIGASGTDLDGIAEYMLNTDGVEVSALLSEREEGLCNISLRSMRINVSAVAERFSGGGHVNAAGGSIRVDLDEAARLVTEAVKDASM